MSKIRPLMKLFMMFWLPKPRPMASAPPRMVKAVSGDVYHLQSQQCESGEQDIEDDGLNGVGAALALIASRLSRRFEAWRLVILAAITPRTSRTMPITTLLTVIGLLSILVSSRFQPLPTIDQLFARTRMILLSPRALSSALSFSARRIWLASDCMSLLL